MKLLFVCLGNICRSSAAEEILRQKLIQAGLSELVTVDSAGLISYHEGELPDQRMRKHAQRRGYYLTHLSRPIRTSDFTTFDLILPMDQANMQRLHDKAKGLNAAGKLKPTTDFCQHIAASEVPDPYYGGAEGFESVLDILEDACDGIVAYILDTLQLKNNHSTDIL